jgi:hypothetical protein
MATKHSTEPWSCDNCGATAMVFEWLSVGEDGERAHRTCGECYHELFPGDSAPLADSFDVVK